MTTSMSLAGPVDWNAAGTAPETMYALPKSLLAAILRSCGGTVRVDSYDYMYGKDRPSEILIEKQVDPLRWIITLEEDK